MLRLDEPSERYESEFFAMLSELDERGELRSSGYETIPQDFPDFLQLLRTQSIGLGLSAGEVPRSTFWLVDMHGRLIGESRLRHVLTPQLEEYGGHIGYFIRPTERRKGFGIQILALTLQKAAGLGIARARLTCESDNVASARIIERNGGQLSSYGISPVSGKRTSQYWIEL